MSQLSLAINIGNLNVRLFLTNSFIQGQTNVIALDRGTFWWSFPCSYVYHRHYEALRPLDFDKTGFGSIGNVTRPICSSGLEFQTQALYKWR
jgi:hypothetical protein